LVVVVVVGVAGAQRMAIIGGFGIGATVANPLRQRGSTARRMKPLLFRRTSA